MQNLTTQDLLPFNLGEKEYAIDILSVQEIREYEPVTPIANAPDFLKGVINLRGIVVPIVDLRIKFCLDKPTYDQSTTVIILKENTRTVGIVVDSVSDVITLHQNQVCPANNFDPDNITPCVVGVGNLDERMFIILDTNGLMSSS
ncbi:chemotaxis protein CheW [Pseudomonas sp. P154a]|mgnify:CR=1 FL=1|uniref:chemotaxis protein CheW n=1 Tax=Pseudomonas mucoides TaxID=2730424 RepID=UPI00189262E0|nr:chemotaxis protein CheW [Pseudomonas mucoides]MBF6037709.1 chemotaxis protein CheW [Pseudomonas mucoides]